MTFKLVAVVVANEQGKITEWNDAATAIFHWTPEEAIGRDLILVTPARHRYAHLLGFHVAATEKRGPNPPNRVIEIEAIDREGNEFPVRLHLSGKPVGTEWFYRAEIQRVK